MPTRPTAPAARATDPVTSHEAAADVTPRAWGQRLSVLSTIRRQYGARKFTLSELTQQHQLRATRGEVDRASDSGIRSRVAEMVADEWVKDTGETVASPTSGRRMRLLQITPHGQGIALPSIPERNPKMTEQLNNAVAMIEDRAPEAAPTPEVAPEAAEDATRAAREARAAALAEARQDAETHIMDQLRTIYPEPGQDFVLRDALDQLTPHLGERVGGVKLATHVERMARSGKLVNTGERRKLQEGPGRPANVYRLP